MQRFLNSGINSLIVVAGVISFAAPSSREQTTAAVYAAAPSSPATAPYVATMTFDVASVREKKNIDMASGVTFGMDFVPNTATFRGSVSIDMLISTAYGVQNHQIAGLPNWPFPTLFVIEGKGNSQMNAKMATLTGEQQWAEKMHMLQALLEDRFKLKTHWETKQGDIYNLVAARGGPKLGAKGSKPPSAEELKSFADQPVPPLHQNCDGTRGCEFIAHGGTMSMFAEMLEGQFGRPVIDKTGLTGSYDFDVKYGFDRGLQESADDPNGLPALDRALVEDLGLKVEAARGPIKKLVIDHVEMPSEN